MPPIAKFFLRQEEILRRARGKRVLHLGCVGLTDDAAENRVSAYQDLLHARLSAVADVTGVDSSAEVVEEYRRRGYCNNITISSVLELERERLRGPFDLIIAGDIIEHVTNPGVLLDGIAALCDEQTEVIFTTPNAFGLPNYLRFLFGKFDDGLEHVVTFNPQNLVQLLGRHGFDVIELSACYQELAAHTHIFKLAAPVLRRWPKLGGTLFAVARRRPEPAQ